MDIPITPFTPKKPPKMLSGDVSSINVDAADCNQDLVVRINDVTALIDYLLSGTWN